MKQLFKSRYLRLFTVASLLLMALFFVAHHFTHEYFFEKSLLKLAEERANNLTQQMLLVIQEEFLDAMMSAKGDVDLKDPETLKQLDDTIYKYFHRQHVARVVLYDKDMTIAYSTQHELIGKDASRNVNVILAMAGKRASGIVENREITDIDLAAEGLRGKLIEIYTPFAYKFDGKTQKGVIELYLDMKPIDTLFHEQQFFQFGIFAVGSLMFFALLLLIASRIELDRIQADTVRRQSEQRFKDVAANLGEWIWETNERGEYTYASPIVENVIGYTPEEVAGKRFVEFVVPEEREIVAKKVSEAFAQRKSFVNMPNRKVHKKGHIVVVETSGVPIIDKDGALEGYRGAVRDITDRRQAEEELRESEERFRSVTQSANDAIISSDGEGKIISWNKGARRIFGYEEEEVLGEPLIMLMPEKYRHAHRDGLDRSISTGEPKVKGETKGLEGLRKDGSEFPMEISLSSWKTGKDKFFSAIIRDITERILWEEELRQAKDKAEKATQLKDRFLSMAAHDLRAPLGSILGLLKIVETDGQETPNRKKELIRRAINKCDGLLELINHILNISMLRAGEIKPVRAFVDMRTLTETAIEKLQHLAADKKITILNTTPENVRLFIDRQLIELVLQNVLSNAIKFSPEGGDVSVYTPQGARTTIAIKDSGMGIRTDILENIFDHDVRTTMPGTAGEKGTGLGMPISKDIVEAHNGSLTVETAGGAGSIFYLSLPFVRPKILVVEDDSDCRFILKETLKELDADFFEAEHGAAAMEIVEKNPPHMIITDCQMPEMDGFDLIERVRSLERLKSIPIIVVTYRTDAEARTKALQTGANYVFVKPFSKEELLQCVSMFIK